jgi:hypothetical protein
MASVDVIEFQTTEAYFNLDLTKVVVIIIIILIIIIIKLFLCLTN